MRAGSPFELLASYQRIKINIAEYTMDNTATGDLEAGHCVNAR